MNRLRILRGGVVAVLLCATSCSEQPTGLVGVVGVKVAPQSIQFSTMGERRQIVGTISPADATDQRLVWESSDSTVAAVDQQGLVTARGAGVGVFVTAYSFDRRHQASVNVSVLLTP